MAVAYKDSRINLRTSLDDKSLLERAASLRHLSLSSYIIATSIRQAQLDLAEQETLLVSNSERDMIMKALENPPKPNAALRKLFKK
ncbi:MAG: DUF1778 domain-containing protein [Spirochaetia bacterium]|jgi:uncharacterized protein (DUF1778 family)|nr:DUF1778 domain-containing protein [Spirochaetia bacterium]MBR5017298.1 DUF1778 domain-containing protein [Spirochaetia bacterium]MBR5928288.1 DUF1778 domain-containing protein [Spirochaetia bacterium]